MRNRILTFLKKRSTPLLCCAVAVLVLGGTVLLSSRAQLSRELDRQNARVGQELEFCLDLMASWLEAPAESPEFIGGLASSFREFSTLDPGGFFSKVGDNIAFLTDADTVRALAAEDCAQLAALLRQLADAADADAEAQLDLLAQLSDFP